jgi:CheY-like chemotaxis protein
MSQQPTVLIVEDDPVFRRVMNFTIARCGFSVETASDGQAAYHRLCQGGIDFLVTDHQMPVCSGLELLEMLESNADVTRPPTILCTAKGLELDSQGLQAKFGLAAVMHKPFSPRKLSELILQIIESDTTPTNPSPVALAMDNSTATVPAVRGPVDG